MALLPRLGSLGACLLAAALPLPAAVAQQQPPAAQAAQPAADLAAAKQEFQALVDAFAEASREFTKRRQREVEAAKKDGKPTPAMSMAGPAAEWLPKFRAGAEKYRGTDGAIPFLVWVGNQSRGADREAVLATLLTAHLQSPELGSALRLITSQLQAGGARLINMQSGQPAGAGDDAGAAARQELVQSQLAKILADNPHANVKAQTLLARANLVLEARTEVEATRREAAVADVKAAAELATDAALKAQLDGILFAQKHLVVGAVAPDIEGPDLEGVAFKLSDYRGKVVLLDFWGFW
ncbi:MAG: hypothetical protein RL398_426 [Planctomycetota bacterium]